MSNVYANGMEVSAKKDANKSICAMPDVCLSPPSPPAGPVPIPYPNTATASDTSGGSKTVKIGGDEVGLKNKSDYKTSKGDEAATRSLGMGVVSHTIQGKMKHAAWSMDVKIEGENVIRHMDLTTHNHINNSNMALVLNRAKEKIEKGEELTCEELDALNQDARKTQLEKGVTDENFTLTTASRTDKDGKTKFMKAVSDNDAPLKEFKGGYQKPVTAKTRMEGCAEAEGEKYDAQGPNHTEPKLLEPEWKGGGSIKMKIFHQTKDAKGKLVQDSMPCGSCKKSICAAQACGLRVILCNKDNQEVNADPELCENGQPKPVEPPDADPDWADSTRARKLAEARDALWKKMGLG